MYKRFVVLFLIYFFVLRPSPTKVLGNVLAVRLFDFISIVLVLYIIFMIFKDKDKLKIKYDSTFLLYILLFVWSGIGLVNTTLLLNNIVNWIDLFELTRYLYYFLLLVVGYNLNKYIEINIFLKHLFIATVISVTISILQFYNPIDINSFFSYIYTDAKLKDITTGNPRVFGTLYNANWFGVYLSFIISIAMAYVLMPSNKEKTLKFLPFITVIMASLGILLSGSRTAIIVSVLGLLLVFILSFINKPNYKLVIIPLSLILVSGILSSNIELNTKRFDELSNLIQNDSTVEEVSSAHGRIVRMEEAFNVFYKNPISGIGFSSNTNINAHNSYITLLYQHGIVGLLIVVLFFVIYLVRILKALKKTKKNQLKYFLIGLVGGITSFLIASLSGEYMNAIQLYSILLLIIGVSYGYYNKEFMKGVVNENINYD